MTIAHKHIRHTTTKTRNKPPKHEQNAARVVTAVWRLVHSTVVVAKESVTSSLLTPALPSRAQAQNLSATSKPILLINYYPQEIPHRETWG
jgi:hypothetical protein